MSVSLAMIPSGFKSSLLYSVLPNDGSGDFTVVRNSACDRIDSNGDSVEMGINIPRLDYRKDYVAPTDTSYYSFDGVNDRITKSGALYPFINKTDDYTVLMRVKINTIQDSVFWAYRFANDSRTGLSLKDSGELSFEIYNGSSYVGVSADVNPVVGQYYNIACVSTAASFILYIDGVAQSGSSTNGLMGSTSTGVFQLMYEHTGTARFADANFEKTYVENRVMSLSEINDRFNGVVIPTEYVGANNFDFTAGAFTIGKAYKILTAGTTDFTLIGASDSNVGTEFTATGVGVGTGTATSTGNVLDLSVGKQSGFWYDLEHDSISTITGATLVGGTFSTDAHGLETCSHLKLEPAFTNHFLNSRVPVTQTVTGLSVGTIYTINAKGTGIITVDETGGNGIGGTVTEVYPLTYTATATSIVITLVSGEAFDWVQLSDTESTMNHVETAGASVTKAKDEVNGAGVAATFNSEQGVLEVEMRALFDTLTNRGVSLSDGTANNVVKIFYTNVTNSIQFKVTVAGVDQMNEVVAVSDITEFAMIKLKYANNNFGIKINGVEVATDTNGSTSPESTLTTMQFDTGAGTEEMYGDVMSLKSHNNITEY